MEHRERTPWVEAKTGERRSREPIGENYIRALDVAITVALLAFVAIVIILFAAYR